MLVKNISLKDNSAKEWLLRSSEKLASGMLSLFPAKSLRTVLATLAIYGAVIGCKSELPVQFDSPDSLVSAFAPSVSTLIVTAPVLATSALNCIRSPVVYAARVGLAVQV
jgi:hypothetical protein